MYRAGAPGFENAFLMLGAPQIGARHSRRLVGARKVAREQWSTAQVWDDEIGVSPSLSPKFPSIANALRYGLHARWAGCTHGICPTLSAFGTKRTFRD
jgi:hypothetical protein